MANKYREHSKAEQNYRQAHRRQAWVQGCARKKRYPTEEIANSARGAARNARGVETRAYYCTECQGWHLTKKGVDHGS